MMNGSCESCVTFAFIVVAFSLIVCQGQACDLTARPHPEGYCGARLALVHANMCLLLRIRHPNLFQDGKRSQPQSPSPLTSLSTSYYLPPMATMKDNRSGNQLVRVRRDQSFLERIYSIPLSVLATIRLTDDNWRSFIFKRGFKIVNNGESPTNMKLYFSAKDLEMIPDGPTQNLLRMLGKQTHKRSRIHKRNAEGLVCECCMRKCTGRQVATYC